MAALRECREEAGIDINLKGILKIDHGVKEDRALMRVIFFAEPSSLEMCLKLKSVADSESDEAKWVSNSDLVEMKAKK